MTRQPGLRARKKEATRDRIRSVAVRLFLDRGFDDVSISEIAAEADVSKMTVFNYFAAKEDIFFSGGEELVPDLAAVVRERPKDQSPVTALRAYVGRQHDHRAEWTGLHDGVAEFARVIWSSPTLLAAMNRRWQGLREDLVHALEESAGLSVTRTTWTFPEVGDEETPPAESLTAEALVPRLVAEQLLAVVQTLAMANQVRQAQGITADESYADARRAVDLAFDLLESGLGGYPA